MWGGVCRKCAYRESLHLQKRLKSVMIGLSGGVDSAVSAYLLKKEGYDVTGVYMRNWNVEEETGHSICPSKDDLKDAQQIASHLSIPLKIYDFEKEYWTTVFETCLRQYERGETPNPDVLCNRHIKFDAFAHRCLSTGVDYIATGHYCQVNRGQLLSSLSSGPIELLKGIDPKKDQSYFLSEINGSVLNNTLFPVGNMLKRDVKKIAADAGIHVSNKKESMGICFIGERNMKQFLSNYIQNEEGKIVTIEGKVIGCHDGLNYYTIGQGIKLANQKVRFYVCDKNIERKEIIVCEKNDSALFHRCLSIDIKDISWIDSCTQDKLIRICNAHTEKYPIQCQLRYQTTLYNCRLSLNSVTEELEVNSDSLMRAVTTGQICVFYDNNVCLGGGRIKSSH